MKYWVNCHVNNDIHCIQVYEMKHWVNYHVNNDIYKYMRWNIE